MFRIVCFITLSFILTAQSAPAMQATLGKQMDDAIEMMRNAGNNEPDAIIAMLNAGAQGYFTAGDLDKAIDRIDQAISLARKEDRPNEFMTSMDIAARILSRQDDEVAYQFLLQQLRASRDKVDFKKQVLKAIRIHLMKTGNVPLQAVSDFEMLQIVHKEKPGSEEEFEALMSFGTTAVQSKIFDMGGAAIREAKEIAKKLNRNDFVIRADLILANSLIGLDENESAEELLLRSANLTGKEADQLKPQVFHSLAQSQIKLGKLDAASASIEKATALPVDAIFKNNIKQLRVPISVMELAAASDKTDVSVTLPSIADTQRKLIAAKAKALADSRVPSRMVPALISAEKLALANLLTSANELEEASTVLDEVDGARSNQQKQYDKLKQSGVITGEATDRLLSDLISQTGEVRQRILIKQEKFREALVMAENTRGRAQVEMLREKLGVKSEINRPLSFEEMCQVANEQDTTIVMYSVIHAIDRQTRAWLPTEHPASRPQSLLVWVLQPDGKANFAAVPLRGSLDKLVEMARNEILAPPRKAKDEDAKDDSESGKTKSADEEESNQTEVAAKRSPKSSGPAMKLLTEILISPIQKWLPTSPEKKVTFIPQDSLFLIPFAALPNEKGEPLLMNHTIAYSPSIEMMRLAKQQQKKIAAGESQEILIVGNPKMPSYQSRPDKPPKELSPLKGAEIEAKYLGDLLGVKPLIGEEATEVAVARRMSKARFIHLATHGLLESENAFTQGYLSAVALAPSKGEDGFLTVRETMRMNLVAELVVLSACDTGRGVITGDGVIGLTQGYVSAGVPSVVVSLWPVSDQATAVLMSYFYQAMLKGADKATALRAAMLKTREQFPSPKLWAPFTICGSAE